MSRYQVTTFDPFGGTGMERLRSPAEFILCACPTARMGWRAILAEFLQDLQSCDRPEGFDYEAARAEVTRWAKESLRPAMRGAGIGRWLGCSSENWSENGGTALLYIHDLQED